MKTGLHCNTVRDPGKILDYYRRSGSKVIKVMEFEQPLLDSLRGMGVTIIGRLYVNPQRLSGSESDRFISDIIARAREFPQVNYWEGYNEEFQDGDELSRYADFEIRRMRTMESARLGSRAIIGCFSTGRPEVVTDEAWSRFRPALEYALPHGHALGLHEYSGPYMQWMCGENLWDFTANAPKRVNDPCLSPTIQGWLTQRHRKAYEYLRAWGLGDLPLYVTEGGVDDVTPRPGGQGKGYKDFAGTEWASIPGIGDYAQQRRWYMWQVSHDRYVRGVVDFGFETADPTWGSFDLSTDPAMLDAIIRAESDLPVAHFGEGGTMTDLERLAAEAQAHQAIQFNPDRPGHVGSALQRAAAARGWSGPSPNSSEWTSAAGATYSGRVCQRFEWPNGRVEVACWANGMVSWHDITALVVPKA